MTFRYQHLVDQIHAPEGFRFEFIHEKFTPIILKWRNDGDIHRYLFNHSLTEDSQKEFLKNYPQYDRIDWILMDEYKNTPVGTFAIKNISTHPEMVQIIGEKEYQGKGLGKKATLHLLEFGFYILKLTEMYAWVHEQNHINIHLLKNIGFILYKTELIQSKPYILLKFSVEQFK